METKMLYAFSLAARISLKDLCTCKSVLCFFRLTDDGIASSLFCSRIVAETDCLRKFSAKRFLEEVDVGDVVKVDDVALLVCKLIFFSRSLI